LCNRFFNGTLRIEKDARMRAFPFMARYDRSCVELLEKSESTMVRKKKAREKPTVSSRYYAAITVFVSCLFLCKKNSPFPSQFAIQ